MLSIWRGLPLSIAAAALAASVGAAKPALAADPAPAAAVAAPAARALPAPVVIIIEYTDVIRNSTAGKAVLAQRDKLVAEFQAEVSRDEQKLRDAEKELARQQTTVTREVFQEKYRAFQQKVQNLQKHAQDRRKAIDEAFNVAMTALQKDLVKVVDEIATEYGANLVLLKGQTFLHDPKFEITGQAVDRLNGRVQSVEFPAVASTTDKSDKKPDVKPDPKKK